MPVSAQIKDLVINADRVSLEKEKSRIEAQGSVEVTYRDLLVDGGHLIYNTSLETLSVDQGFNMLYNGVTFEGDELFYDIKGKSGIAYRFHFNYSGLLLKGEKLDLSPELYKMESVNFTTCDLPQPHYRVSASEVLLYPDYQRLVAYWGFFWLGNFPIVPMPTYIYDLRARERDRKNLPPFPDFGSNAEDGNYLSERLAWNLNKYFSGTYTISYFTNKGVGGGVQGDYNLNDQNEGNLRLYGNLKDGLYGGISHVYHFGEEIDNAGQGSQIITGLPGRRRFELETDLSSRERINYQKVSFLPNFYLRAFGGTILRKEAKYEAELVIGRVEEEGNTRLYRGGGNVRFYGDFPETRIGYIIPALGIDNLSYSNGTRWLKTTGDLDVIKQLNPNFSLQFGYSHYFLADGISPFNFEIYRFRAADRFRAKTIFGLGDTRAGISASYFLDTYSPEDIDYSLFFKLHCYNLEVTYRSLRAEFALGFSLASSQ